MTITTMEWMIVAQFILYVLGVLATANGLMLSDHINKRQRSVGEVLLLLIFWPVTVIISIFEG